MGLVVESAVKKRREQTQTLVQDLPISPEEERILRMRAGACLLPNERLGNKLDRVAPEHREDLANRLVLLEEIARQALQSDQIRKERIIQALLQRESERHDP